MPQSYYQKAEYLKSATKLSECPPDRGIEIAFVGRSNAGKSSAINTITGQKKLAKISKTPGRTQMINFFELAEERFIVDLPGYGYAKVPEAVKKKWQETLDAYLRERDALKGVVLMMDIRHPLKEFDQHMIEWSIASELPVHILLTKSDKLKRGPASSALQQVRKHYNDYKHLISVQLFSSANHSGIEEACEVLDKWFQFD